MMSDLSRLQQILHDAGEQFVLLPLQNTASALVTRRGSRVLGLFADPTAPNIYWTSKAFDSCHEFRIFTARTDGWAWNLGGERIWIAPEISYNVRDRRAFGSTWDIPVAMDPGDYRLDVDTSASSVITRGRFSLNAFHHGRITGKADLELSRVLFPCPNPISDLPLMRDVQYIGYSQQVTLAWKNADESDILFAEAWSLLQLKGGGFLILPVIGAVAASDYAGCAPAEARRTQNGVVLLPLNGMQQFKVAYKALCMTGRMGYWKSLHGDQVVLVIRDFVNDLSNMYAEEQPDLPGNNGHSVHIYNDSMRSDGSASFCELECSGRTLGLHHGIRRKTSTDTFRLWSYVGPDHAIRQVAHALLGGAP